MQVGLAEEHSQNSLDRFLTLEKHMHFFGSIFLHLHVMETAMSPMYEERPYDLPRAWCAGSSTVLAPSNSIKTFQEIVRIVIPDFNLGNLSDLGSPPPPGRAPAAKRHGEENVGAIAERQPGHAA